MAIARRIIESHHGRIEIESVEGQGTSVTLVLLAYPEEKAA
jgi:signal transduction histidine kinase